MLRAVLLFAHLAGLLLFAFAHGVSAFAMLRLRREEDPERIAILLDLAKDAAPALRAGVSLLVLAGFALAWEGAWWSARWLWVSVALFLVLAGAMGFFGTRYFEGLRQLVGRANGFDKKEGRAPRRASIGEIDAQRRKAGAVWLAVVGSAGLGAVLWLMVAKPAL